MFGRLKRTGLEKPPPPPPPPPYGFSRLAAIAGLAFILATSGAAGLVSGGGWCNAGDCVPAPPLPLGPIGSPWGWLPFGLPGGWIS